MLVICQFELVLFFNYIYQLNVLFNFNFALKRVTKEMQRKVEGIPTRFYERQ